MSEEFIKQVAHQRKIPVTVERDVNDVLIIEGVRYHGDLFRAFAEPSDKVLYAMRRNEDNTVTLVTLVTVRDVEDAKVFFEALSPPATPLSANPPAAKAASPQMREERANLGGEIMKENNDAV